MFPGAVPTPSARKAGRQLQELCLVLGAGKGVSPVQRNAERGQALSIANVFPFPFCGHQGRLGIFLSF